MMVSALAASEPDRGSVQVNRDSHRWIRRMETSDMQHKHWRKSAQW